MENKGLLFIPDISGFTKFVSQTDIEHSRLIIQELLEILINANEMGLEVSEVEGDAILFYKFGDPPGLSEIYRQVEKMFCDFHRHLGIYDIYRFCQCSACVSAINLSLKVITHYGEFAGYNVKTFNKLIGKDVIVAHQLLKNDIVDHEYWLVTKNLAAGGSPAGFAKWMKWDSSARQTENGEIPFHYTQLGELKNELAPASFPQHGFSDKIKMITVSREYETDIITLFHATGDFNFRSRWREGVKEVAEVSHYLPRVGMRCRCIMENGESVIYASSYSYTPGRIEFSETDEKKKNSWYYILERVNDHRTKLTIDFYIRNNFLDRRLFLWSQKSKTERQLLRSLERLDKVATELVLPG